MPRVLCLTRQLDLFAFLFVKAQQQTVHLSLRIQSAVSLSEPSVKNPQKKKKKRKGGTGSESEPSCG